MDRHAHRVVVTQLQSQVNDLQTKLDSVAAEIQAMQSSIDSGKQASSPFDVAVAQYALDSASIHEMAANLSKTKQIDPAYQGSITRLRKVIAMGCLTERYRVDLEKEIPEVDRFFGTHQLGDVLEELGGHLRTELLGERYLTTPSHSAYLKISEGCENPCSFCPIPSFRGHLQSRPMADVVREAVLALGVPAIEGLPAGHVDANFALPLGARATLVAPAPNEEGPPRLLFDGWTPGRREA